MYEDEFLGGVFVAAADVTGDGRADVVVTPDVGGGPVAVVYDGSPAVLVLRPVEGATQVAALLQCGTGEVLRSVTLPVP